MIDSSLRYCKASHYALAKGTLNMAPASEVTAAQTPPSPPKRLKEWQVVLATAALPICLLVFFWGVFSVYTLTGEMSTRAGSRAVDPE